MRRYAIPALILAVAAVGCGARSDKAVAQFNLTSSAFQNGAAIPTQYTCDGADQSPPLAWGQPPPGTKSLALVVDDPDAPHGTFHHWGAYDVPAATRSMAAGQSVGVQAVNDSGKAGYKGPCPPKGDKPHHYRFKLYALDTDRLGISPDPKITDVENAAQKHLIGRAELIGTYQRR
jgi:Raf kinase inhibitor-like YbhB/YbcL family protein